MTNIYQINFAEQVKETTLESERVIQETQNLIRHLEYQSELHLKTTREILAQCKENMKICADNSERIFKRYDKLVAEKDFKQ